MTLLLQCALVLFLTGHAKHGVEALGLCAFAFVLSPWCWAFLLGLLGVTRGGDP